MRRDQARFEHFLNNLEGEVVSVIPYVSPSCVRARETTNDENMSDEENDYERLREVGKEIGDKIDNTH